jgi:hypothetical protein
MDRLLRFQYNPNVKTNPTSTKDQIKIQFTKNRGTWVLGEGIENLVSKLSYTHQFGINTKSTKNSGIEYYDFCCIDFDAWSKETSSPIPNVQTVETLRKLNLIKLYSAFDQPSLSYRDNAQNTHFYFVLSRTVGSQYEFELLMKALRLSLSLELNSKLGLPEDSDPKLGFDACVANNPGQVIYGGYREIYRNKNFKFLPVDEMLDLATEYGLTTSESTAKRSGVTAIATRTQPVKKVNMGNPVKESAKLDNLRLMNESTPHPESHSDSITDQVLDHLYHYLYVGVCEGNARKLYDHTEEYSRRSLEDCDAQDGVIERWEGNNIFSQSNNSGTSFMIIVTEGLLPRFWDKSGTFQKLKVNNFSTVHGSFIDYYFFKNRTEKYPDIKLEKGQFPKGFFTRLVRDICNDYQIPEFKFKSGLFQIFSAVFEKVQKITYTKNWDLKKAEFQYLVFDEDQSVWKITAENHFFRSLAYPMLAEEAGSVEELKEAYNEFQQSLEKKLNKSVYDYFRSWFHDQSILGLRKMGQRPAAVSYLASMRDGVWNFRTKQLEEEKGQAWNIDRNDCKLDYNCYPVDDNNPIIVRYKKYIRDWIGDDDQFRLVFSWQVLTVLREAYKTRNMLVLMGKNSGGKSTYANQTLMIMSGGLDENGQMSRNISAEKTTASMLLNGNPHTNSILEGLSFLYLDEMNNLPRGVDIEELKNYIQSESDRQFQVNPKNQEIRKVYGYFAMTGASEGIFKGRTSNGIDARIRYANVNKANMNLPEEVKFFQDKSVCEVLFNWMIRQDAEYWLKVWREAGSSSSVKDNLISQKRESDELCEFIDMTFILTDDPSDRVEVSEVWQAFNNWKITEQCEIKFASKQRFSKQFHETLNEDKYGYEWKGTKVQVNGGHYVYTNLRLKNATDNVESVQSF